MINNSILMFSSLCLLAGAPAVAGAAALPPAARTATAEVAELNEAALRRLALSMTVRMDMDALDGNGVARLSTGALNLPVSASWGYNNYKEDCFGKVEGLHAYNTNATHMTVGNGMNPLGASTASGFTISYHRYANWAPAGWSNLFGFRIGGVDIRTEVGDLGDNQPYFLFACKGNDDFKALYENREGPQAKVRKERWEHVAYVFGFDEDLQKNVLRVYVDGVNTRTFMNAQAIPSGVLEEIIVGGGRRNGGGISRGGVYSIDDVAVFSRALSADERNWLVTHSAKELGDVKAIGHTVADDKTDALENVHFPGALTLGAGATYTETQSKDVKHVFSGLIGPAAEAAPATLIKRGAGELKLSGREAAKQAGQVTIQVEEGTFTIELPKAQWPADRLGMTFKVSNGATLNVPTYTITGKVSSADFNKGEWGHFVFGEGAALAYSGAPLEVYGNLSGTVDVTLPEGTEVGENGLLLMKSAHGQIKELHVTISGGYLADLRTDGWYAVPGVAYPLKAEVTKNATAWSQLQWTDATGTPFAGDWQRLGKDARADIVLKQDTALTVDVQSVPNNLTVTGDVAEGQPVLKMRSEVRTKKLRLQLDKRVVTEKTDGVAIAEFGLTHKGRPVPMIAAGLKVGQKGFQNDVTGPEGLTDGADGKKWFWDPSHRNEALGDAAWFEFTIPESTNEPWAFDGYTLTASDRNYRNPSAWRLFAWNEELKTWYQIDRVEMKTADALAWKTGTERSFRPSMDTASLTLNNVTLAEASLTGTLTASNAVVLKAEPGCSLSCGRAEGTFTVDTSALTKPEHFPFELLRTPVNEATLTLAEGQEGFLDYRMGSYWVYPFEPSFHTELTGEQTWEAVVWKRTDGQEVPAGALMPAMAAMSDYTLTGWGTLILDAPVQVNRLTVAEGKTELAGEQRLTIEERLTIASGATLCATQKQLQLSDRLWAEGTLEYTSKPENTWLPHINGKGTLRLKSSGGTWIVNSNYGQLIACENGHLKVGGNYAGFERGVTLGENVSLRLEGAFDSVWLGENARLIMNSGSEIYSMSGNISAQRRVSGGKIVIRTSPENPAVFSGACYGNAYGIDSPIVGMGGLLRLKQNSGNSWQVFGAISGTLAVETAKGCVNTTFSGENTFTKGLKVVSGSSLSLARGNCAGNGNVTVEAGAQLWIHDKETPLIVRQKQTLTLCGELHGAVELHAGAVLLANKGTIGNGLHFAEKTEPRSVKLILPEGATEGDVLFVCGDTAPDLTRFDASDAQTVGLMPVYDAAKQAVVLGEYREELEPKPDVTLPDGFAPLPETAMTELKSLLASVVLPNGAQPPTKISQIVADPASDARPETLSGALSVFSGITSATVDANNPDAAIVMVSYTFSVTDMRMAVINDTPHMIVTATVQSSAGTADFAPGAVTSIQPEGTQPATLAAAEASRELTAEERATIFGPDAPTVGIRYLTIPISDTALIRVTVSAAQK